MRANIYIRQEHEKRWANKVKKKDASAWVNAKLDEESMMESQVAQATPRELVEEVFEVKPGNARVIKNPEDVTKILKKTVGASGICKTHGVPLDNRGKCLVKGCKYGK